MVNNIRWEHFAKAAKKLVRIPNIYTIIFSSCQLSLMCHVVCSIMCWVVLGVTSKWK